MIHRIKEILLERDVSIENLPLDTLYKVGMDNVRENTDLVLDFRKEASDIIFKYTDGYKEYCTFWNAIRNFF